MLSFKEWIAKEDAFQGGDQFGNEIAPEDRGLKRPSYLHPAPISKYADKLYGFRSKKSKKKCKK